MLVLAAGALAVVGAALALANGPDFPQKTVWIVFFLTAIADLGGNALYSLGGIYTVLYPALFWTAAVYKTTGALALGVGIYAAMYGGNISSHWYSLPTGCSFLATLATWFPAAAVMATIVAAAAAAVFVGKPGCGTRAAEKLAVAALALVAVTLAEDVVRIAAPVEGAFELARGIGIVFIGLLLSGGAGRSAADVVAKLKKKR